MRVTRTQVVVEGGETRVEDGRLIDRRGLWEKRREGERGAVHRRQEHRFRVRERRRSDASRRLEDQRQKLRIIVE